jgi:hypothetical protein
MQTLDQKHTSKRFRTPLPGFRKLVQGESVRTFLCTPVYVPLTQDNEALFKGALAVFFPPHGACFQVLSALNIREK